MRPFALEHAFKSNSKAHSRFYELSTFLFCNGPRFEGRDPFWTILLWEENRHLDSLVVKEQIK